MKKISFYSLILLAFFAFSTGCSSGPSDPGVCNCAQNAMKITTPDFDQDLQTKCEEFSATLSESEKQERALKTLSDCF